VIDVLLRGVSALFTLIRVLAAIDRIVRVLQILKSHAHLGLGRATLQRSGSYSFTLGGVEIANNQ
jgi:hypothetical protein